MECEHPENIYIDSDPIRPRRGHRRECREINEGNNCYWFRPIRSWMETLADRWRRFRK
jgi:hypothetical protein